MKKKKWNVLTMDYCNKIKTNEYHCTDYPRKIKFGGGFSVWAYWDSYEKCWFWNSGEDASYMDEENPPTHILSR